MEQQYHDNNGYPPQDQYDGSQRQSNPANHYTRQCRFFQSGNCKKGTECTFLHDAPSSYGGGDRSGRPGICRHFAKFGNCKFGDGCKYIHDSNYQPSGYGAPRHSRPYNQSQGPRICKFFQSPEGCKFGDSCKFSHEHVQLNGGDRNNFHLF